MGARREVRLARAQVDRSPVLKLFPGEETVSAGTALSLYLSFPRIEPGCPADLTAFPRDPAKSDPEELLALAPVLTVFDGEVVHRAS